MQLHVTFSKDKGNVYNLENEKYRFPVFASM